MLKRLIDIMKGKREPVLNDSFRINSPPPGIIQTEKGGKGSGNFGHEGRIGERGGSGSSGGGNTYYHGTPIGNLDSIMKSGLLTKHGGARVEKGKLKQIYVASPGEDTSYYGAVKTSPKDRDRAAREMAEVVGMTSSIINGNGEYAIVTIRSSAKGKQDPDSGTGIIIRNNIPRSDIVKVEKYGINADKLMKAIREEQKASVELDFKSLVPMDVKSYDDLKKWCKDKGWEPLAKFLQESYTDKIHRLRTEIKKGSIDPDGVYDYAFVYGLAIDEIDGLVTDVSKIKSVAGILKGGQGSGNFGHEGRPGERGGSGEGGRATVDANGFAVPTLVDNEEWHAGVKDSEWDTWATDWMNVIDASKGTLKAGAISASDGHELTEEDVKSYKDIAGRIQEAAMSNVVVNPPYGNQLFRGEVYNSAKDVLDKYKSGKAIEADKMVSLGFEPNIATTYANAFAEDMDNPVKVTVIYQNPNGIRGVNTSPSTFGPSGEVVIPKGAKYRVAGKPEKISENEYRIRLYSNEKQPKDLPRINVSGIVGEKKMLKKLIDILKGGKGSGNFGHSGRPGEQGGSSSGGGSGREEGGRGSPWKGLLAGISPSANSLQPVGRANERFTYKDAKLHMKWLGFEEFSSRQGSQGKTIRMYVNRSTGQKANLLQIFEGKDKGSATITFLATTRAKPKPSRITAQMEGYD